MIKGLTYKQKNLYLAIASIVLLVLCYQLAIKNTIEAKADMSTFEKEIKQGKNAQSEIEDLKNRLEEYNLLLGVNEQNTTSHERILEVISRYCQKKALTIDKFPSETIQRYDDFSVSSNVIEVRGTYKNLLQLIHYLETKEKMGKIVSTTFLKKKDKKTKRTILRVSLHIQNQIS